MTLTREENALAEWESSRPTLRPRARPARDRRAPRVRRGGARVVDPAVEELRGETRPPDDRRPPGRLRSCVRDRRATVWASGVVSAAAHEQAALLYVLAHAGEGGHSCPVVCTAGLVRALRGHASDELRERFLPPLLERDYDRAQRGAQFLIERQAARRRRQHGRRDA